MTDAIRDRATRERIAACSTCGGTGRVAYRGGEHNGDCPDCLGSGRATRNREANELPDDLKRRLLTDAEFRYAYELGRATRNSAAKISVWLGAIHNARVRFHPETATYQALTELAAWLERESAT